MSTLIARNAATGHSAAIVVIVVWEEVAALSAVGSAEITITNILPALTPLRHHCALEVQLATVHVHRPPSMVERSKILSSSARVGRPS